MKRNERTIFNSLRKTVTGETINVEIPEDFSQEARQAIHELLTIEKGFYACAIFWNSIQEAYCIHYERAYTESAQSIKAEQEAQNIDNIMRDLPRRDYTWNGYQKNSENSETENTETETQNTENTENTESMEGKNMNNPYPNICELIISETLNKQADIERYMRREGSDGESTLRNYSTESKWNAYYEGKISKETAICYALDRLGKKCSKEAAQRMQRVKYDFGNAPSVNSIIINVQWKKSSVWGMNPTATVDVFTDDEYTGYEIYTGKASGCGYDKLSAAVSEAMNQSPSLRKLLCDRKEQAIKEGVKFAGKSNDSNSEAIAYGAGYGAIPYYEGGVGISSIEAVLNACGMVLKFSNTTKNTDHYVFERKA